MIFEEAIQILKNKTPLRISVGGDIGAGKSTFAKRLAKELDVPRIYIGGLMREEAAKKGISLDELNVLLDKDDEVDRRLDELQKEKSKEIERGVFEGRLAWYFVENPDAKIFLGVDPVVAATRIWNDKNNKTRDSYESIDALSKANIERKKSEELRYSNYHGVSAYDPNNFDINLDTTDLNLEQVYQNTVIAIAEHISANS